MSSFDAKEGMFHFLFAEEDDYYLNSLVRLNLRRFLYYSLKKKNYKGIYFFRQRNGVKGLLGKKEEIAAYCMDETSGELYLEGTGQYFGYSSVKREKEKAGNEMLYSYRGKREDAAARILNRVDREEPCAFVMHVSLMNTLLSIDGFAERLRKKAAGNCRKSILLLTASDSAEDSFETLCEIGRKVPELFPEIEETVSSRERLSFYRHLKLNYGDRMQVWNQMERKHTGYLLRRMCIAGEFQGDERNLEAYADILYAYFRDRKVQCELESVFRAEAGHSLRNIRKNLQNPSVWSKMDEIIAQKGKAPLWNGISRALQKEEKWYPSYPLHPAMRNLKKAFEKEEAVYGIAWDSIYKEIEAISTEMTTCWNKTTDYDGIETEVSRCITKLEEFRPQHLKHKENLRYSPVTAMIDRLWYRVCRPDRDFVNADFCQKKMQVYDAVFHTSASLMLCQRNYDSNRLEIDKLMGQLTADLERYGTLKGNLEEKGGVFVVNEQLRIRELEKNIYYCKKLIEKYNKLNIRCLENMQSMKEVIDAAHFGISQLKGDNLSEISRIMKELNDLAERQKTEEQSMKNELAQSIQSLDDIYGEELSREPQTDIFQSE